MICGPMDYEKCARVAFVFCDIFSASASAFSFGMSCLPKRLMSITMINL